MSLVGKLAFECLAGRSLGRERGSLASEHLEFALFPVLVNSVVLVAVGIAYNIATGRRYPYRQIVERKNTPRSRFSTADLDAVLQRYNQVLDVSRDELEDILHQT